MAEKYIVNMPLKTTPDDTDLMIIEDAQDTKRMTWANVVKPIKDLIDDTNEKLINGEWITIDGAELTSPWTVDPAHPLQYRKTIDNRIVFRGRVVPATGVITQVCILPTNIRPVRSAVAPCATGSGSTPATGAVFVTTTNFGIVSPVTTVVSYIFDGFSYYLD